MRKHPVLGSLLAIYLLIVGVWAPAALPVVLVATGAFTVLAQPPVFLAALAVAGLVAALRHRPAPASVKH
ncbi:hypothetical protein [Streptomyces sp. NPDC094149]|uniref:hypothetical protein n=1 Tax=Streptomyces sp. NPDC094149 TaxID=3155079 RepID=UPI00332D5561